MVKFKYTEFINALEDDNTKNIIGKIDTDILSSNKVESLYYSFPLIERMILEIYKLSPLTDVEHNDQGTMRTVIELLKNNCEEIPTDIVDKINVYFEKNGLRNEIFHVKGESLSISIDFLEINYIIFVLLSCLKKKIVNFTDNDFKRIEYI